MGLGRDVCEVGEARDHCMVQPFAAVEGTTINPELLDPREPHMNDEDHHKLPHTLVPQVVVPHETMPPQRDCDRDAD